MAPRCRERAPSTTSKTEVAFTSLNGQVVSEDVESTGIVDTVAQTVPEGSTPGLQRMNQG